MVRSRYRPADLDVDGVIRSLFQGNERDRLLEGLRVLDGAAPSPSR